MSKTLADLTRLFDNLLCFGVIAEVNHADKKLRVNVADRLTGWLPYPAHIGQNYIGWNPLRPGTQVLLGCPSGNPANAVILQVLYTDDLPPPSTSGSQDMVKFQDGTFIRHDSETHLTEIFNPEGTVVLDARNVVIRTGENGYFQLDHAGKVTRLTHMGDNAFQTETWEAGAVVTSKPDHGFSPPKVSSPGEGG